MPSMASHIFVHADERAVTFGNDFLECRLELHSPPHLVSLLNKYTGTTYAFNTHECSVQLASGQWLADIPEWRFCPGSGDAVLFTEDIGYRSGFHLPDAESTFSVDTAEWTTVQQLNAYPIGPPGYSAVTYPGYGWYRSTFHLPSDLIGQPIELVLGGCDNQDWIEYWVYLNGVPIGHARPARPWHDAPRFCLSPGDEGHGALRYGGQNHLAVQTRGLDRSTPAMSMPDAERYSVGSLLVDQYIAVAPAQTEVAARRLIRHHITRSQAESPLQRDQVGVDLQLADDKGTFRFTVRYWVNASDPVLYKQVEVRNDSATRQTLLEMDLHTLVGDHPVSTGGMGLPCIIADELFCGIRHPAGLAQGHDHELRLRLFPGRELAPGEAYTSKLAVFGVGPAGEGRQSFLRYLERHSPRARAPRWLSLYDVYGWHDIAGIDNPTPVTDELVQRSLDVLAQFQKRGITFDYYDIDTGWNNPDGDLRDFDPRHFPAGPAQIVQRVRQMGMRFGLWVSPAAGPMAFHPDARNPALVPCGTLPRGPSGGLRGSLCMASEPWRGMFREALLYHVRANEVRNYKLDGNAFFCTNPDHHHLPGKYSIEPIMDAMIDTLQTLRRECPDIMIMYYWGISSPWWLLYGDTLYERGVLMEGATPCDFPSRLLRQSVTASFDQAAHHAWDTVPLPCHDSLGVWISDTRWGNWMGREGWQDAWIMDIARGSGLTQLWGDISTFDENDIRFLSQVSTWLRDNTPALKSPRRIGGDPWEAQPYGYAYADGDRAIVFAYNPQYRNATMVLDRADIGVPLQDEPNSPAADFAVQMQPFEVKMLQIDGSTGRVTDVLRAMRGAAPMQVETRLLAHHLEEVSRQDVNWEDPGTRWALRRAVNGRAQYVDTEEAFRRASVQSDERDRHVYVRQFTGHVSLPAVNGLGGSTATLDFIVRLSRDGIFWHHHALFDIIQLTAKVNGKATPTTCMPSRWHEQAGGWSWILFRLPLDTHALPAQVQLNLRAYLPASVDTQYEAWLCRERNER